MVKINLKDGEELFQELLEEIRKGECGFKCEDRMRIIWDRVLEVLTPYLEHSEYSTIRALRLDEDGAKDVEAMADVIQGARGEETL